MSPARSISLAGYPQPGAYFPAAASQRIPDMMRRLGLAALTFAGLSSRLGSPEVRKAYNAPGFINEI
jgi:hypothetical protein